MSSMDGLFKFYQNGKLIGESKNNITENGRILAIKTLMGAVPSFGNSIKLGVDGTANTLSGVLATNTRLGFQIATANVSSSHISNESYDAIVFKARVNDLSAYDIYEAGLFADPLSNGETNQKTELAVSFEDYETFVNTSGGALTTSGLEDKDANSRIGSRRLKLVSTEAVEMISPIDALEFYTSEDDILLAGHNGGLSNVNVTVTFYNGANTAAYVFTLAANSYGVYTNQISSGTLTGDFQWSNIDKIRFSAGSGTVRLDGLRFEKDSVIDPNFGMVSRTSLSAAPIQKAAGAPLDIEYYLRLGFNG